MPCLASGAAGAALSIPMLLSPQLYCSGSLTASAVTRTWVGPLSGLGLHPVTSEAWSSHLLMESGGPLGATVQDRAGSAPGRTPHTPEASQVASCTQRDRKPKKGARV